MTLHELANEALKERKILVLKLTREPSSAELQYASILVVNEVVVKNRFGRRGPWAQVQDDMGGTPIKLVEIP